MRSAKEDAPLSAGRIGASDMLGKVQTLFDRGLVTRSPTTICDQLSQLAPARTLSNRATSLSVLIKSLIRGASVPPSRLGHTATTFLAAIGAIDMRQTGAYHYGHGLSIVRSGCAPISTLK